MRLASRPRGDERGDYAAFIAVIAAALLLFGALAYDGPRLIAARQHALHEANEAALVAAATVAGGGTLEQAHQAAQDRVDKARLIYNQDVHVAFVECVGTRVEVTVVSGYVFRSFLGLVRPLQPIHAIGAAEARLVLPSDDPAQQPYLSECRLS